MLLVFPDFFQPSLFYTFSPFLSFPLSLSSLFLSLLLSRIIRHVLARTWRTVSSLVSVKMLFFFCLWRNVILLLGSRLSSSSPFLSSSLLFSSLLFLPGAVFIHGEKSRSIRDPLAKAHLQTARPHLRFQFHLLQASGTSFQRATAILRQLFSSRPLGRPCSRFIFLVFYANIVFRVFSALAVR